MRLVVVFLSWTCSLIVEIGIEICENYFAFYLFKDNKNTMKDQILFVDFIKRIKSEREK